MTEVRVTAAEERAVIIRALVRHGAIEAEAAIQAEVLLDADLCGHASHGLRRLPTLTARLSAGLTVSGLEPDFEWRSEAGLLVDGRRGFGPVVARLTLNLLVERAATTGVAIAGIRNAGHVGMLAPYLERLTADGYAGLALTVSEALVHPTGGRTPMVGTNPIGIGIPTLAEPLILDMSTAEVSMGKILDYAARGEDIPIGWAIDAEGEPTSNATAAAAGAISPFGGAKGYALGLAIEALVGIVAGSAFGRDVHGTLDTEHPASKGDLFLVLDLDVLGATQNLGALTGYLDAVRASGGSTPVGVPGDRARRERAVRLEGGIPLDAALWAQASALADGPSA